MKCFASRIGIIFSSVVVSLLLFTQTVSAEIRAIYLVPSDKAVSNTYINGIENAMEELQWFYYNEINQTHHFELDTPVVEVVQSNQNAQWFADDMWSRAINAVSAQFNHPDTVWIIYVDADLSCSSSTGIGGTSGIAVMDANDLRGLSGQATLPSCNGTDTTRTLGGWIGGSGHEVGHAVGLPHPPGCDNGDSSCDSDALMWLGYLNYPNTYLTAAQKQFLRTSSYFKDGMDNVVSLPYRAEFESEIGMLELGEFNWTRRSGTTPSSATGPSSARQGNYYAYLETSAGSANASGDTALLETPPFNPDDANLSFDYHMYGSNMGTLAVDVYTNNSWTQVWAVTGQKHASSSSAWSNATIDLDGFSGLIKVRFRGVANGGYRGDMAIDKIRIDSDIIVTHSTFDGTWAYVQWTEEYTTDGFTQFIIGDGSNGRKWLYRKNSGANDRGNYFYQYYHRNDICNAFGSGTFSLSSQIWVGNDSANSDGIGNIGSITCP